MFKRLEKLFAVICLMFICFGIVQAADQNVWWNLGFISGNYWFRNVNVVVLTDLNHENLSMIGAETPICVIAKAVSLNLGDVTSEAGKGTPYLSADYLYSAEVPATSIFAKLGLTVVNAGPFAGYDFNIKDPDFMKNVRAGFKVSVQAF